MAEWLLHKTTDDENIGRSRRGPVSRFAWIRRPLTVLFVVGTTATIAALTVAPQAWPIASVSAAAIVVGLIWPRVSLATVSAELTPEASRGVEGEALSFRLHVRNRAPWSVLGLAFDAVAVDHAPASDQPPGFADDRGDTTGLIGLEAVGAAADEQFVIRSVPRRRGLVPRRTTDLAIGFPFGLEIRRRAVHTVEHALVHPKTWPLIGLPKQLLASDAQDGPESKQSGTSGTTLGLRPYRRGDSPRDVHWPQTARCRELIVCERAGSETSRISVVVDLTRLASSGNAPEATLDWIVRGAASLAVHFDAGGVSAAIIVPGQRGIRSLHGSAALDALAEVEFDERSPASLFSASAALVTRSKPGWFVTTPAGYHRLTSEQRAARGWSFLIIDTGAHDKHEIVASGVAAYLATLPVRAPSESQPGDAFHVRRLS